MRMIAMAAALAAGIHAAAATEADNVDVTTAMRAADAWLALVDRGAYGESWEQADRAARESVPRVQWEVTLDGVRARLGVVNRRKLRAATYARDLPGAPPGEYVVIQYDTAFDNRPMAVETITPVRQKDGSWRVSGYFVK